MRFPVFYRGKNHMLYTWFVLIIGLVLGVIDVTLEFYTTEFNVHRYNCAAIGCFQDKTFRAYWGISNMASPSETPPQSSVSIGFQILNIVALILTIWVAVELNLMRNRSPSQMFGQREQKQLNQVRYECLTRVVRCFPFLLLWLSKNINRVKAVCSNTDLIS